MMEMVTCEVEDEQSPICVFSIRSPTTSVDYSINKVQAKRLGQGKLFIIVMFFFFFNGMAV